MRSHYSPGCNTKSDAGIVPIAHGCNRSQVVCRHADNEYLLLIRNRRIRHGNIRIWHRHRAGRWRRRRQTDIRETLRNALHLSLCKHRLLPHVNLIGIDLCKILAFPEKISPPKHVIVLGPVVDLSTANLVYGLDLAKRCLGLAAEPFNKSLK